MIHLITYGDYKYSNSKTLLLNEAVSTGWFDTITSYGPEDLDDEFKNRFSNILGNNRGGGYWIWKPYIIKKHLDKISENDILIYLDAGCSINLNGKKRFNEYIEMLNRSDGAIISFQTPHADRFFTIKDIFQHFNFSQDREDAKTGQLIAGVLIIKNNLKSTNLINMWNMTLYENPLLFTDHYNGNQEPWFSNNTHDQSVFSIIRKLHNPDPTLILTDETYFNPFGNEESLRYPFWATRRR